MSARMPSTSVPTCAHSLRFKSTLACSCSARDSASKLAIGRKPLAEDRLPQRDRRAVFVALAKRPPPRRAGDVGHLLKPCRGLVGLLEAQVIADVLVVIPTPSDRGDRCLEPLVNR